MNHQTRVRAILPGGQEQEWTVRYTDGPPWTIDVITADGRVHSASSTDLFRALQEVRRTLDEQRVLLCCNGSRLTARPSPRAAADGALFVYLVPGHRPPVSTDLVPLLAPAPPDAVVTVEQQDAHWLRTSHRRGLVRLLNPVRVWKAAETAIRGPVVWAEEPHGDGTVSWRSVNPRKGGPRPHAN